MVMNGAACSHPLRSFWARQREKARTKTGESTSASNQDLLLDEIETRYLVGSKDKYVSVRLFDSGRRKYKMG